MNDDPLIDDFRTVDDLDFIGAYGPGEGRGSGFNDLGQITFAADFTDGTYGVFISNAVANFDTLLGDIDFDGDLDLIDIRLLGVGIEIGANRSQDDIDTDGDVDLADLNAWLALLDTVNGDANLDLQINTADLAILAGNFFNHAPTYAQGDFNLDGSITTADLAILAGAFGPDPAATFITPATTPLVPEPAALALLGLAGLAATARRRAITAWHSAGA
ncbi:MAG: PEP-CTERM sorting domain-containing protein [Planctomycetota bacterium]